MVNISEDELKNLLAALVEQARALATRMAGDPDRSSTCHFCGDALPLWENLLVLQLTGVAAHVRCPVDALDKRLKDAGPAPEFPYADFCSSIEHRLQAEMITSRSGVIEGCR